MIQKLSNRITDMGGFQKSDYDENICEKINEIIDLLNKRECIDNFISYNIPEFTEAMELTFNEVKNFDQRLEELENRAILKPDYDPDDVKFNKKEWKYFPEDKKELIEDENYLISYLDDEGKYSHAIRAYWCLGNFHPTDTMFTFPLKVDIFMEMPKVPKKDKNEME